MKLLKGISWRNTEIDGKNPLYVPIGGERLGAPAVLDKSHHVKFGQALTKRMRSDESAEFNCGRKVETELDHGSDAELDQSETKLLPVLHFIDFSGKL